MPDNKINRLQPTDYPQSSDHFCQSFFKRKRNYASKEVAAGAHQFIGGNRCARELCLWLSCSSGCSSNPLGWGAAGYSVILHSLHDPGSRWLFCFHTLYSFSIKTKGYPGFQSVWIRGIQQFMRLF